MAENIQNTQKPKHRGRPRKAGNESVNPREHIVETAIKLFKEKGYAKTSLSEISRHVGIDQSSIYYWFSSKEAILEQIFSNRNIPLVVDKIENTDASNTEKLYALIIIDVVTKCELPFDYIELESVIHEKKERFNFVYDHYRAIYQGMVYTINEGIKANEFSPCNAEEKAVAILSVCEGLQHHYHAKIRDELILEASGYTVQNYSPDEIGCMAANTVIGGLAIEPLNTKETAAKVLVMVTDFAADNQNRTW